MDGKQRLTSISDFFHGRIPCHDKFGNPWYFAVERDENGEEIPRAKKHRILPDKTKNIFIDKEISCCEYKELTERQEREIFQRVQLGMPLTPAEALRATSGGWQEFAQEFEVTYKDVVSLAINRRAGAFRRTLTCFSQIYECKYPSSSDGKPRLKHTVTALENFCRDEESLTDETKRYLHSVFRIFQVLVHDYPEVFLGKKLTKVRSFAPLELVAICVLISENNNRPKGMLRGDIDMFRDHLREAHADLQLNTKCWATCWDFIHNLGLYRGMPDNSTIPKAPQKAKRGSRPSGVNLAGQSAAEPHSTKIGQIAQRGALQRLEELGVGEVSAVSSWTPVSHSPVTTRVVMRGPTAIGTGGAAGGKRIWVDGEQQINSTGSPGQGMDTKRARMMGK
jgi:hypothetical protein